MATMLIIRDPDFGNREAEESIQTPEVPAQIQEVPTHI